MKISIKGNLPPFIYCILGRAAHEQISVFTKNEHHKCDQKLSSKRKEGNINASHMICFSFLSPSLLLFLPLSEVQGKPTYFASLMRMEKRPRSVDYLDSLLDNSKSYQIKYTRIIQLEVMEPPHHSSHVSS